MKSLKGTERKTLIDKHFCPRQIKIKVSKLKGLFTDLTWGEGEYGFTNLSGFFLQSVWLLQSIYWCHGDGSKFPLSPYTRIFQSMIALYCARSNQNYYKEHHTLLSRKSWPILYSKLLYELGQRKKSWYLYQMVTQKFVGT